MQISFSGSVDVQVSAPPLTNNTITLTNVSGSAITNYPLQFGRPFVQGAIPHIPTVVGMISQADVKNHYPDGSVEFAIMSVVVPTLPATGSVVLTIVDSAAAGAGTVAGNTPLTTAEMLAEGYNFEASITATPVTGTVATASARTMLSAGAYTTWTSGPVAQTIILADDSIARAYDMGFDGVHHPLRPRFYATFWPLLNSVFVRVVGENCTTTEAGDLTYSLSISVGDVSPTVAYTADLTGTQATHPKLHWLCSNWSRKFWIGTTPPTQVNINHNLPYLITTRWLPAYDTTITPTSTLLASEYLLWTGMTNDLYDGIWNGGSKWQSAMGTTGERQEIGPYPTWDVLSLYTGDWRMRTLALGLSELAAAWPIHFRETDPTRRLQRTDPTGSGTGLGHTISITDRKTMQLGGTGTFTNGSAADRPIKVGNYSTANPWLCDGAHQPQPWFVPYVTTGDPWYLNEAYLWAGFSAARYNPTQPYGRGPTGAEGGIADELRGTGWVLRSRTETALMAPDAHPEKAYFITLTNDALKRWEGGLHITGTVFDNTAEKNWGIANKNYYSSTLDGTPPPLHNWESLSGPSEIGEVTSNINAGIFNSTAISWTSPWMQYYNIYGLGRAAELGFATEALLSYTAQWFNTMITDPTSNPQYLAIYESPVNNSSGYLATWEQFLSALNPTWVTGVGFTPPTGQTTVSLPTYYSQNLNADGRVGWATVAASFITTTPGGAAMWEWFLPNVYLMIPDWTSNAGAGPKWAILPRTDPNTLPPMPTS